MALKKGAAGGRDQGSGIRAQEFMRRFAPGKDAEPRAPNFPAPAWAGGNFLCSLFPDI
ncbi:MAG: hypothetical protein LBI62_09705 [Candidatus Accumulibacter sp.]|jgi:hypothetical protein|nr:hypothetical protein [Accumulibacter sp.]